MNQRLKPKTKLFLALMMTLYGAYLFKTFMGINISNRYSASWIFKMPLEPLWAHKPELCQEFHSLCTLRSVVQKKVQHKIEQVKQAT
ncbi:MAG: hypothetical protein WCD18_02180 [Thermosynechococcaceae cyanobacterium]